MVEKVLCMDLRTNALLTGWLYVISSWLALVIGILLIIMDDKIATLIIDFNPPLDYHDMLRIRRMLHCEFHIDTTKQPIWFLFVTFIQVIGFVKMLLACILLLPAILLMIGIQLVSAN